jgi:hypothetical protein
LPYPYEPPFTLPSVAPQPQLDEPLPARGPGGDQNHNAPSAPYLQASTDIWQLPIALAARTSNVSKAAAIIARQTTYLDVMAAPKNS